MLIKPKKRENHGMTGTRIHNIWRGMRARCYNPNTKSFKNYGGRNIAVCQEWNESFIKFYKWSLNNGYSDDLTIDRIDVNEDYSPANCRWISIKAQQNNRSNNVWITFRGETHTEAEWSDITGISRRTLNSRLVRYGWTPERALTTPTRKNVGGHYV